MKKLKTYKWLAAWVLLAVIMTSCAPGNEQFTAAPAGFFMGLWHGFISFFSFVISLFSDTVAVYESNNTGGWYDFGFIMGISIFYGGSSKSTCR